MPSALRGRVWLFWLAAGIAMAVFGMFRGEVGVIFRKAVLICLECIGIG